MVTSTKSVKARGGNYPGNPAGKGAEHSVCAFLTNYQLDQAIVLLQFTFNL